MSGMDAGRSDAGENFVDAGRERLTDGDMKRPGNRMTAPRVA
jgi:hypothetical protein